MNDLESARATLAAAGLPFPPVPPELVAGFRTLDTWFYGSGPVVRSPYDQRASSDALCQPGLPSSLLLAHAGHGSNSYAMHYNLVRGALRLLLQTPGAGCIWTKRPASGRCGSSSSWSGSSSRPPSGQRRPAVLAGTTCWQCAGAASGAAPGPRQASPCNGDRRAPLSRPCKVHSPGCGG